VAKEPAKNYNPLFIYGGTGLGKTHLMHAIGHYVLYNYPELKVKYTNTENFTNDLVNCLKKGGNSQMSNFRQKYRYVDVLLLDDIQFIESKIQTQEEIFHTFEYLHGAGKQIVITSDRHPKNIPTLTDRLRSRFEWGLLADIQPPDIETRIAILQNKSEMDNMNVPQDIIELIATAYTSNIRELEGALNRVVAYSSINESPLTIDTVRKVINFTGEVKNLNIDKVIEETAKYFAVEPSIIKGQGRSKDISYARQIAIYLTRELIGASFPVIGESFGKRKHTSILYAYEKVKEDIGRNKKLNSDIEEISREISCNYKK
ncbi:MAG: chromosomal replication initiator protein DnaA, partial [Candidatus Gastranaerophilales bacterium]|nr:chromosomal replication initiator protein DnaA [Candidatus Gastranaerophilales bacterium]